MCVCIVIGRVRGRDHMTFKIYKVFVLGHYFAWIDTNESKKALEMFVFKTKTGTYF